MTRFPVRAVLPACACVLFPVAALAQSADGAALAPLLTLLPPQWTVYAPAAVGIASLLDALLPHVNAGSWLSVPRALITTLAGNVGNATNAQGQTLPQAVAGLVSRNDAAAPPTASSSASPVLPDTVRRDTEA